MTKPYKVHIISNTHWDREWLHNFQETRMKLIEFFDLLLEVLETEPSYRSFVLDSQAVPVEDYLAVRPENTARVRKQVEAGRLLIGPWYTCPECFEVNGESLARNLLMGHKVAAAFGHVMKVGHTPFSYGQNSQMPQLYAGFGIDTILFYHGVSHDVTPNEFIFEGADGTRIFGSQMSSMARYNFYHHVYRPAVIGKTIAEREYEWREGGMPFHRSSPGQASQHYQLLAPPRTVDPERLAESVRMLRETERRTATTRHLTFMMGHDSSVADPLEKEIIELTRQTLTEDEVVHGHYEEMMAEIKAEVDWDNLPVLRGERRVPKLMPVALHMYSDVLSSRTRMKNRSSQAEYLIQRRAEPFSVAAAQTGAAYPEALFELAWKTMLQCHAHDSISGSGVDAIEEDMMNRLRQVLDIGEGVYTRSLATLQQQIDNSALPDDAVVVTVYNPSPRTRSEVVSAVVDLPWEGPRPRGQFTMRDAATGETATTQLTARKPQWAVVDHAFDAPSMMRSERFTIQFEARAVPGLGHATFVVDRQGKFAQGSLVTAMNTLENEYLIAAFNDNGTLDLHDKESGVTYECIHYFVDDGEGGHAWMHQRPAVDRAVDSRGFPVTIALEEEGPLLARYRVEYRMRVPSGLDENGGEPWQRLDGVGNQASRGSVERDLTIVSRFTLRRGARALEVETTFDNTATCHRLRVLLPTHRSGTHCHVESAFDVVERETVFGEDSVWEGARGVTFPMQRFVDVSDHEGGIAFVSQGLREYEVTQGADRCIAVTLLRAYEIHLATVSARWESHPEMTLSQAPGVHTFEYRIHPHAGPYDAGGVLETADSVAAPLEPVQSGVSHGDLPQRHGFLEIEPATIQLSAYKRAENGRGWILRLYNPCERETSCTITAQPINRASTAALDETPEQELPVKDGRVSLTIAPKKIVTLLLEQ